MFVEPDRLDRSELLALLDRQWRLGATSIRYQPVGFGSHHYLAIGADDRRWFVNVDELSIGASDASERADRAFADLRRALRTTLQLRRIGLEFVHPPTPASDGELLARLDSFAVSVFEFVAGTAGEFGSERSRTDRRWILAALGRMHAASPEISSTLPRRDDLTVSRRTEFLHVMSELDRPWTGGPFAEPAREALSGRTSAIHQLFEQYDALASAVRSNRDPWVVTHGEPHPGNVLHPDVGTDLLIDWDTVAIGPPERDLWHLAPLDTDDLTTYLRAGGTRLPHPAAIRSYRLNWQLSEICSYAVDFRAAHADDANTRTAWAGFVEKLPRA